MTFSLYTDDEYLPFLNLGDTSGISQIYIPSSLDGASSAISTPNFAFGSSNQSLAYVTANGFFSFGRRARYFNPVLFPESASYNYLVAPFWADHDIRSSGQISYEVHTNYTALVSYVSTYISQQMDTNFTGSWMLVADWNEAPKHGSTENRVS